VVWDGVRNLASATADATVGAVKRRGGQLLHFAKHIPRNAAVFVAQAGRKLSDGAAHHIEKALLTKEERMERMKAEYSDALDRLLRVQTWFEKNAPTWLSKQVGNPAGKHSHVIMRPEEVRSLHRGEHESSTQLEKAVGPEGKPDRTPSAFCKHYKCAGKTMRKCRNKSLKKWHPDMNVNADREKLDRHTEQTKHLNSWWEEVKDHGAEMCGP
jgi:hypothetical protein